MTHVKKMKRSELNGIIELQAFWRDKKIMMTSIPTGTMDVIYSKF